MIEFMLVIVLFMVTLMGTFEVCRLLLSFATLANASRVGIRYATTHGSENEVDFQTTAAQIRQIVLDFTVGTLIDTSKMTVTTTWPNGTDPGDEVRVHVELAYEPFILLPMSTTLATQTEGIVTF
jgi:Flp pilus assembly protein TadG